jgi:predicted regulator of Ras-like GTPase activity (Roadblock/LC7/MglB family)
MVEKEDIRKISKEIKKMSDVKAYAVISRDGFILESANFKTVSKEALATKSASMFNGVQMVLAEMMDGKISRTIAESEKDRLIVMSSGSVALLAVVTDLSKDLDDTLKSMEMTSAKIKSLLG